MKVGELLNTSDWFELERIYPAVAANVQTPMLKQMAEALLASNFIKFARKSVILSLKNKVVPCLKGK